MQGLEKLLARKWMIFILFLSLTYLFGTKSDRRYAWTKTSTQELTPIASDAAGYYAFLPEWFIYEGNNFAFNDSIRLKYPDTGFEDGLTRNKDGSLHDKYFTGTAQCLTPFFLIGHVHAQLVGVDADGYTWPYIFWLNVAMGFYAITGLIALFLLLRRLKIDYFGCYIAVLTVALGTNFSYYVYIEFPYSHVFCFSIVNLGLLQALKWIQENKTKNLLFFGFLLGLCLMIRPTNALILCLLPFFFSSNREFVQRISGLFKAWKNLLLTIVLFMIPVFVQVWFFYLQMGEIRLNSYSSDEGFTNWNSPYIWETLFGFRKGIFIYGPVLLLLIPGLIGMFFKNRRMFAGVLIFMLLSTYVLSSWWCWWYGGSLGYRAIVDFYGIWVIPIAFLAHYAKAPGRIFIFIAVGLFIWVYQTYEFQKKRGILHFDYISYGMWKTTFMKTDSRYNFAFYSDIDTVPVTSVQIGSPVGFSVGGELLVPGKVYGYKGENLFPTSFAAKQFHVKDSNSFIGLRVNFKGYLNSAGEVPYMLTEYFRNGSEIAEKQMPTGWRFDRIKDWEDITVDIVPDLKWSEVDSVKCSFIMGEKALRFKDLQLLIFKFK